MILLKLIFVYGFYLAQKKIKKLLYNNNNNIFVNNDTRTYVKPRLDSV